MSFKVTREWIHAFKTGSGGWRRAQLAAIGIAWPPEHGWIERCLQSSATPMPKPRTTSARSSWAPT